MSNNISVESPGRTLVGRACRAYTVSAWFMMDLITGYSTSYVPGQGGGPTEQDV